MRKVLIVSIILGVTIMFTGCGSKVSEAYKDYISQAKVEIVNGDYDKALQFLTLAKDENTGDRVVDELSEQIDMYRKLEKGIWTAEDGNLTEDLYKSIEEQLEEANKFIKRKFESNLMIENIKIKIEELSVAVDNAKEMQQQALEEEKKMQEEAIETEKKIQKEMEVSSNISLEMYDDLDNKRFEEAYNKSFELETSLKALDSYGDYYERNYPLYSLIINSRKVYNGINKLNLEKENDSKFYSDLLNEVKTIAQQEGNGELFLELLTGDGSDGYYYHAIFKKENGNYIKYYRHVKGVFDFGFSNSDEEAFLVDLLSIINGDSTVSSEESEWDPTWNAKPDGFNEN